MKKYLPYLLLIVACYTYADSNEEFFLQANKLVYDKSYQEALQLYSSITNKGPAVWFNMAFCLYKLNKLSEAKAYWYRARRGYCPELYRASNQFLSDVAHALKLEVKQSWSDRFKNMSLYYALNYPLIAWQLFFLVTLVIAVLVSLRVRRKVLMVIINVPLLFLACIIMFYHQFITIDNAVIKQDTPLCLAPDESLTSNAMALSGSDVVVLENSQSWYKVCYANTQGWVPASAVIRIKDLT